MGDKKENFFNDQYQNRISSSKVILFQFDLVVHNCIFNLPSFATPPFLKHHFPFLNPQIIENTENLHKTNIDIEQPENIKIGQPEFLEPKKGNFRINILTQCLIPAFIFTLNHVVQ